ncbi:MAG: phosphatidylglycerophosphatase A [Phycisphaerae bacterium]|nr:phosphatidylglycerophosphatase A [Phycisphaerae bacterium]
MKTLANEPRAITVWGLGHLRPAPGTWGSLPPIVLGAALWTVGLGPERAPCVFSGVMLALLVVFTLVCAAQGDRAEGAFGRKDPSEAVADETAGQCIPLLLLPGAAFESAGLALFTLAYAFLAFRAFDILKPWPARQVQRVPGGWGIVLDDLVAGVYAALLVQVLARALAA